MEELGAILETGGVAAVEIAASAMAARGTEPATCPNCKHPMIGPYCAICGQPHNTHRRTVKHLVHELVKDIVSFDSRILRTAKALLLEPGELPKAFRDGRTQPYVPAVRLYLFVSLLFFLFLSVTGIAFVLFEMQVQTATLTHDKAGHVIRVVDGKRSILPGLKSDGLGNVSLADPRVHVDIPKAKADGNSKDQTIYTRSVFFQPLGRSRAALSPELKKAIEQIKAEGLGETKDKSWFARGLYTTLKKLETDPAALNAPMTVWMPRILFVLLPLFAALLMLFYRRQREEFYYVDHLVFSLTIHSFVFVVLIFAAILAQVLSGGWVAALTWVSISAYLLISMKRFYSQSWTWTGLKFVGVTFVYSVFCLTPAMILALVASAVDGG